MVLKQVSRERTKMRLAIMGEDNSGKTLSALLTAYGLCKDWSKVVVIDTERGASSYYAYLGRFNVLKINSPCSPEKLMQALHHCEQRGMEVIILDSASDEWTGEGGTLDLYSSTSGTSTEKWKESMSYHYEFVNTLLDAECHVIATLRYRENAMVQQKEFTSGFITVLQLDQQCRATVLKDRTQLFSFSEPFVLSPETAEQMAHWCNQTELKDAPTFQPLVSKSA